MKKLTVAASVFALFLSAPSVAGEAKPFVVVNEDFGVPVFPYDFKDRQYEVLGEVKAGVRKATVFSPSPSQAKIYRELWERAKKLGADAVINATYGDAHVTAFSWGKANAKGTAVRFKASAAPTGQSSPPVAPTPTPTASEPPSAAPVDGAAPTTPPGD